MPRQSLLQRHRNSLDLLTLCKRDVGDGAAILQRWCDADGAGGGVASQGLLHRRPKRSLEAALPRRACSTAARSDRFAFAIVAIWLRAAVRSSPSVIGSALTTAPLVWSTTTSKNLPPF